MLQNFRTYQLAKLFYKECELIEFNHIMRDQLLSAALSVVNNLLEGSARKTAKDRARFYAISLASFRECQGMLDLLGKERMLQRYDHLGASLFNLHKYTLTPRNHQPSAS